MYFKDRAEAGLKLAAELGNYRYENTAVLALSEGGVLVGEQIAKALHCTLSLLLTEPIKLPDLGNETVGVVDQSGAFTYNQMVPLGTIEQIKSEMHSVLEEQKMQKFYELTKILSHHGLIDKHSFYGHNVILVDDGLKNGMALDAAVNFLKPIKVSKMIGATPFATVKAVDRLHMSCDEIHVINVIDGNFEIDHYYEDNHIGDTQVIIDSINQVVRSWV